MKIAANKIVLLLIILLTITGSKLYLSNQTKTPQFDPYSYDIKLKDALKGQSKSVKDSIKAQVQEVVELKSFNFTNVRKERLNPTRTPKAYDIENVSLSYSFTERDQRNPTIESDNRKDYRGLINYGFSAKPPHCKF